MLFFPIFSYTFQIGAEVFTSASNSFTVIIMSNSIGLYLHIPFCKSKCPYCDFYSTRAGENEYDNYVISLREKLKYWSSQFDGTVKTVYIGGGTPSVLGAERLCDILNSVKSDFTLESNAEITVEINPDSGKKLDFSAMKNAGFNRLSIGMQSAVQSELKKLGRIHTAEDARHTVKLAKSVGFTNISLDLMTGIPLQTKESLKESIDFCASCGVTHISSYILKIEENTRFAQIESKLNLPSDDEQAELYLYTVKLLEEYGYLQYEISNFAKKGYESRHNSSYWECGEYLGIGPSAHSFFKGRRFFYDRNIENFKANKIIDDGEGGTTEEFIMLSLRLKKGLNADEYEKRYGTPLPQSFFKKAQLYIKNGFMVQNGNSFSFTPKGFLVSNTILSDLI